MMFWLTTVVLYGLNSRSFVAVYADFLKAWYPMQVAYGFFEENVQNITPILSNFLA
jgi:hypothetical protein